MVLTELRDWVTAIQGTIQIMAMSVHWKISCQREFKRSGRTAISLHIGNAWGWCSNLLGNCIGILPATRLASLQIDIWPDYLLSSSVAIPMFYAIFSGHETVMLCSWVATLVQQHISKTSYVLSSSSSSSKSELPVLDVCGAMSTNL